ESRGHAAPAAKTCPVLPIHDFSIRHLVAPFPTTGISALWRKNRSTRLGSFASQTARVLRRRPETTKSSPKSRCSQLPPTSAAHRLLPLQESPTRLLSKSTSTNTLQPSRGACLARHERSMARLPPLPEQLRSVSKSGGAMGTPGQIAAVVTSVSTSVPVLAS